MRGWLTALFLGSFTSLYYWPHETANLTHYETLKTLNGYCIIARRL